MERNVVTTPTEVTFLMPTTESLGQLKEMKMGKSLTLKYRKADDWARLLDQEVRAFYMGTKEIPNDKGEIIVCGVFVTENECFISGQKVLVDSVKHLDSRTPVAIVYKGKRPLKTKDENGESKKGETMIFEVKTLIPAR